MAFAMNLHVVDISLIPGFSTDIKWETGKGNALTQLFSWM